MSIEINNLAGAAANAALSAIDYCDEGDLLKALERLDFAFSELAKARVEIEKGLKEQGKWASSR